MPQREAWDGGAVTPPNRRMRPERNAVKAGRMQEPRTAGCASSKTGRTATDEVPENWKLPTSVGRGRHSMPKARCPRCGEEGWLVKKKLKGKYYLYIDHYEGRGKHKVHYLGSASKYPELAQLAGIELEAISSKNEGLVASYQQLADNRVSSNSSTASDLSVAIPGYEEFMRIVELMANEGNEDAKKLMKRIKKDKVVIERTLRVLSIRGGVYQFHHDKRVKQDRLTSIDPSSSAYLV